MAYFAVDMMFRERLAPGIFKSREIPYLCQPDIPLKFTYGSH